MKTKLLNIVSKLGLALMLAPVAMAQQPPHLLQDNVVMQAIEPMNWHPGGKNFGFSSSRGTVTNQKGSIKPQMVGNIRVGNFSVQNASLKGVLSYDTVFDNHGYEVHGNFGSTIKSEASEKSNRNDGSQVSYSLKWTATMNHPADAYDGVQGGGYPSPTGARDEYSFDISGVAVGTYLVTEWSMDAAYKPNIDNRNQNYLKALEASQDRNSAKLDKAFNNPDRDLEWYHRVIYGFNGTLGLMASPVTGLGGFMQPEFEQASQGIYYLENKSIKDLQGKGTQQQFDAISNWAATYHDIDNASQWLAERPMIGETLEAGSWLVGGSQVAKSGLKPLLTDAAATGKHPLLSDAIPRDGDRLLVNQGNLPTCGANSCGMVLDTMGKPVDISKMIGNMKQPPKGIGMDEVAKLLTENGIKAIPWNNRKVADLAKYTANGTPVIVRIVDKKVGGTFSHAVVVDGITTRNGISVVAIRDPWGKQYFSPVSTFEKQFSGQVVVPTSWNK
jgi:hypothetical protein